MFCTKCGKQIDDTVKYCVYCGADVQESKRTGSGMYTNSQNIKTYLTEAILVTIFCCQIGGIIAIVHAAGASSAVGSGDYDKAIESSRKAKYWVDLSFWIGIVVTILYCIGTCSGMSR